MKSCFVRISLSIYNEIVICFYQKQQFRHNITNLKHKWSSAFCKAQIEAGVYSADGEEMKTAGSYSAGFQESGNVWNRLFAGGAREAGIFIGHSLDYGLHLSADIGGVKDLDVVAVAAYFLIEVVGRLEVVVEDGVAVAAPLKDDALAVVKRDAFEVEVVFLPDKDDYPPMWNDLL